MELIKEISTERIVDEISLRPYLRVKSVIDIPFNPIMDKQLTEEELAIKIGTEVIDYIKKNR